MRSNIYVVYILDMYMLHNMYLYQSLMSFTSYYVYVQVSFILYNVYMGNLLKG